MKVLKVIAGVSIISTVFSSVVLGDGIFKEANDGLAVEYQQNINKIKDVVKPISQKEIGNIVNASESEINESSDGLAVVYQQKDNEIEDVVEPTSQIEDANTANTSESQTQESTISQPVTYNFDSIETDFAAEFAVAPDGVYSSNDLTWLQTLAGGSDKSLNVLFGRVKLKKDGYGQTADFIKVNGQAGSERFIGNGAYFEYNGDSPELTRATIDFSSGIRLDGTTISKDYTGVVKKIVLVLDFNSDGTIKSARLHSEAENSSAVDNFANKDNNFTSSGDLSQVNKY